MFAAYRGNDVCLRELLSAGADPNTVGYFGETALTLAAVRGHEHCLIALIDAGSDVNRETNSGATALSSCVHLMFVNLIFYFLPRHFFFFLYKGVQVKP